MAKRESTIKLIQNNTNKIISIKIEQEATQTPPPPTPQPRRITLLQMIPTEQTVHLYCSVSGKIDWGDNEIDYADGELDLHIHNYRTTSINSRLITIDGDITRTDTSECLTDKKTLTAVRRIGSIKGSLAHLFENCTKLMTFVGILDDIYLTDNSVQSLFAGCTALKKIVPNIFDNCRKLTDFRDCFNGCYNLTGESPYTMVNGKKIKLWERSPENGFAKPTSYDGCFRGCDNLSDYDSIPSSWK